MDIPKYAIIIEYEGIFEDAVSGVTESLASEGFGILTEIDVKETLKKKLDVDYPKYKILGACNPPNAFKALQAEREIGLLLPCNVIVYENDSKVYIGVMKPTAALTLSINPRVAKVAEEVESKLLRALKKVL